MYDTLQLLYDIGESLAKECSHEQLQCLRSVLRQKFRERLHLFGTVRAFKNLREFKTLRIYFGDRVDKTIEWCVVYRLHSVVIYVK